MKGIYLTLLLQCAVFLAIAQYTLKGTVRNDTGGRLVGANMVISNRFSGTTTDVNGAFHFKNLKAGNYHLTISFLGYEKQTKEVKLAGDQTLDIIMKQDFILAEEVLVSAIRVKEKMPVAFTTVEKSEIRDNNLGQDIPYLLLSLIHI